MFFSISKHHRRAIDKILRSPIPPEVAQRLAAQTAADREAAIKEAADHAFAQAEAIAKAEAAYKATLQERMKREQAERFLINAEKFS